MIVQPVVEPMHRFTALIKSNISATAEEDGVNKAKDHIIPSPVPGVERIVGVSTAPASCYLHIVLPVDKK